MSKPLLTLSTLDPERPVIAIDDVRYECRVIEDFGAVEIARMERLLREANRFRNGDETETDEQAEARAQAAEDACRKAIRLLLPDLPAETLAKLRLMQLLAIVQAYQSFIPAAGQQQALPSPLPSRIGARSSRVSKDSTAATPPAG